MCIDGTLTADTCLMHNSVDGVASFVSTLSWGASGLRYDDSGTMTKLPALLHCYIQHNHSSKHFSQFRQHTGHHPGGKGGWWPRPAQAYTA
jgi:hypothetical protein